MKPEELGAVAPDDLTFQITTQKPFPPMPGMMKFGWTLQAKALKEHYPLYNTNLETAVSSGPWIPGILEPGKQIVLAATQPTRAIAPTHQEDRWHLHGSRNLLRCLSKGRNCQRWLRSFDTC